MGDLNDISFNGRTAIITGAGRGLGRAYALELVRRGANVIVNDFGGSLQGDAGDSGPAHSVVAEIEALGGRAFANHANVADAAQAEGLVGQAVDAFGAVDIVICNAGIIRDRTFAKKSLEDFRAVVGVHLWGTVNVLHAAWPHMLERQYGRVLLTTSVSGTLGSFGQSDYSCAKAAMFGLMSSLALEGARKNVHVNAISPAAATRISQGVLDTQAQAQLAPERVVPAAVYLVSDQAPTNIALQAGGGAFSRVLFAQNHEIALEDATAEDIAARFPQISLAQMLFPVEAPKAAG